MSITITENFEYVVKQAEKAKICFGMSSERVTLPMEPKFMNSFMRRYVKDNYTNIGPYTYKQERSGALYNLQSKPGNKRGCSAFIYTANREGSERVEKRPGPAHYNVRKSTMKFSQLKHPFNTSSCRFQETLNENPAANTYNIPDKSAPYGVVMQESFGGKRCPIIAVECKCVPENLDLCKVCGATPVGDYFKHLTLPNTFICMKCIRSEPEEHLVFSDAELKQFKRLRDCSFMHQHNGTTAAIRLMTKKEIRKKYTLESYLSRYFPC